MWLPALELLVLVDEDEELELVLVLVAVELDVEFEVVLLPLTASQISVTTFWVAESKSAVGGDILCFNLRDTYC